MSRYTKIIDDREYAWGFDIPLQEYFFQCFDMTKLDEDDLIFNISSFFTEKGHPDYEYREAYTNGQILEIIDLEEKVYGEILPNEHKEAIAMDLTF